MAGQDTFDRTRQFYDRWRHAYDLFTRRLLPLRQARTAAATALALDPGDRILELGCGTGANVPFIRDAMQDTAACEYLGVDIAPLALRHARAQQHRSDRIHTSWILGDARDPPITAGIDAIVSSFVLTIFPRPAPIVREWLDLLTADGRLVLVLAHPSDHRSGFLLNPLFNAFLLVANPPPRGEERASPWRLLTDRVERIRQALQTAAGAVDREEFYGGLVSVTVARPEARRA